MIIKSWSQLFPCQFFFWSKYHHHFTQIKNPGIRNFLACQWLGLCAFTAKGVGSIPVWGTKILQASWYGQKNQNRKQTNKKKQTPKTMASSLTEICFSLTFYIKSSAQYYKGFPGGSDSKESTYNAGDLGFNPWVRKIPWRREWLLTPVFLPGESHGQRSLARCSLWAWVHDVSFSVLPPAVRVAAARLSCWACFLAAPMPVLLLGIYALPQPTYLLKREPDNVTAQAHTL